MAAADPGGGGGPEHRGIQGGRSTGGQCRRVTGETMNQVIFSGLIAHFSFCYFLDAWIFFSRCFPLEVHAWKPNCTSNGIFHADRCFSRHKFDANQRESIVSGEMGFPALSCRCYELNCTAEMAGIEFEFFESPTFANPVLSLSLSLSPPPSPLRLCSWALSISLLLFSLSLFPINANAK